MTTHSDPSVGAGERPHIAGFNPVSPEFLSDPYPFFERARRDAPVFFHPGPPMAFWVLTKYDDVARLFTDPATFSSKVLGNVPIPDEFKALIPEDYFSQIVQALDPPEHTRVRKLQQKAFRKPRMEAMELQIKGIADELLDKLIPLGGCDLLLDFARPLTLLTILRHLGLPEDDLESIQQLGEDLLALYTDGINPMPADERRERWERFMRIGSAYTAIVAERAELHGDEDTLAMLAHGTDESGCPIRTHQQLGLDLIAFLTAGMETTANLICEICNLLEQYPEQREELRADHSLIPQAVDEGLRRRQSSIANFRIPTRDVEFRGHPIPAGTPIWGVIASACHDEEVFPNPREFDIHRPNAGDHLGFSKGTHFCVGAPLARVEARMAIATLLRRVPTLRVPEQELRYARTLGVVVNLLGMRVDWD
jgi:cytochrome P450